MATIYPTPEALISPLQLDATRLQIMAFCADAFPGARAFRSSYNNRISVTVPLGDGASASIVFETRALRPDERVAAAVTEGARIEIGGYMYGVQVVADARGKASCQRFTKQVAAALTAALNDVAINGAMGRTSRITMPTFSAPPEAPERGIA